MTNPYYNRVFDVLAGSRVGSSAHEAEFERVEAGFDALDAAVESAALAVTTAGSNTTSTTSNSIGTGSKTWTVETGKSLVVGMHYKMADTASPSNWALGLITAYNSSTGSLTINVSDVSGSGTLTAWTGSIASPITRTMTRRAVTGADTVAASDIAGLLDITSGTFTLAYTAAAALGSGFWCVVRNSGTGDVTHDPASSETIDGLTSFVMYPGEARLIQCDGTAFRSVVLSGFNKTFTASGTFTKPPGYNAFGMLLWGAGASGGKGDGSTQAGGGGGGACFSGTIPASAVSTTESVTIGSGGVAVTASVTAGNVGGNSSFGSLITSYGGGGNSIVGGGGGGLKSAGSSATGGTPTELFNGGGTGGNSAAGTASYYGGGGGGGGSTDAAYAGGASIYGGGGGGNAPATTAGAGGTSVFGGAGGAGGVATNGTAGTAPGGGGGATKSGAQSGAGARGELRIWGIA